jgi:hypothetical protein
MDKNKNTKKTIKSIKVKGGNKTKKIKPVCHDSDSDSNSSTSECQPIRTDLWTQKQCTVNCNDATDVDSDQCVIVRNCEPICAKDLVCIQKNLLTVCRIPLASAIELFFGSGSLPPNTLFSQLLLTYEIVIINKTNNKISDICLFDSLAGMTFENNTMPFTSEVSVIKCPGNITLYELDEVAARKGQLNDPSLSYLPPNSVTKILLKLALGSAPGSICEIRYVQNSICLEGTLEVAKCKGKGIILNKKPLIPLTEKSNIWQTDSDFMFIVGLNINVNL